MGKTKKKVKSSGKSDKKVEEPKKEEAVKTPVDTASKKKTHSKGAAKADGAAKTADSGSKKRTKGVKGPGKPKANKMAYFFGGGSAEGTADMRNLLGGKGANLNEMSGLGLPVPPGFTITTEVCTAYNDNNGVYPAGYEKEMLRNLARVEKVLGRKFGATDKPLLLSVRSGARVSMPGMMDTILNLGLNDTIVAGLAKESGDRFAWDCYRRFIQMFGEIVDGIKAASFETLLDQAKEEAGVDCDANLTPDHLRALVTKFKALYKETTGNDFPQEPRDQLFKAITAVFSSWNNDRAVAYRKMNHIPASWGTATNVQAMVYGNLGENSATGVAFTRDPASGENRFFGEWLRNAQGEDVVSGVRTPQPINGNSRRTAEDGKPLPTLEDEFPEVYKELFAIQRKLELHYHDMQDLEFTVQDGKLYMLQTRNGKRTSLAAFRMAADMVEEGLISRREAISRIDAGGVAQFLQPLFDREALAEAKGSKALIGRGLPAGPGAACGRVAFSSAEAQRMAKEGPVILVRQETSPEDIKGMSHAQGVLTVRGGMTSHAALVCRGIGKVAVVGAERLKVDYADGGKLTSRDNPSVSVSPGDWLALDGSAGHVYTGKINTMPSEVLQVFEGKKTPEESPDYQLFSKIMQWADQFRRLGTRMNADTGEQARVGMFLGAEGIGLVRTEHMFFEGNKIDYVRQFILASTDEERSVALEQLEPLQRADFRALFEAVGLGRAVTIRMLDPPLHEFLPKTDAEIKQTAEKLKLPEADVRARSAALHESNSMLGFRGVRVGMVYPKLTEMQAKAAVGAAADVYLAAVEGAGADAGDSEASATPPPALLELMVPLVINGRELANQMAVIRGAIDQVLKERNLTNSPDQVHVAVGSMLETPRACLTANELAEAGMEFASVGSNDLHQSTLMLSRDDAWFIPQFVEQDIFPDDPFATIDVGGVGQLIKMAVERSRSVNPKIKFGICGEHGGDPRSIAFCNEANFDYVSASPFRLPVCRLAAAQAAIAHEDAEVAHVKKKNVGASQHKVH